MKNLDLFAKRYSSPFRIWLGPILCVYISDTENAELILKSKDCLEKPYFIRKIIKDLLHVDGLLTIEGFVFSIEFLYNVYNE